MADQAAPTPAVEDDSVNLINPNGHLVSVPGAQAKSALGQGYRTPTSTELTDAENEQKYGEGTLNELKAGALGAAGAFSFGAIPEALSASGLVPAEEQAALAKYNPIPRVIGEGVGIGAGIAGAMLTGGASVGAAEAGAAGVAKAGLGLADVLNPIAGVGKIGKSVSGAVTKAALPDAATASFAKSVMGRASGHAAGAAVEGGIFGLGQSIDEHAMGDPDALGEHLLHNIGYGTVLGGLAGGGLLVTGDLFGKMKGVVADWKNPKAQAEAYREGIRSGAISEGAIPEIPPPVGVPGSLDDIQAKIKGASYQGITAGELPAKQALLDASALAGDLEYPVHGIQLESLSDARTRDYYKALLESQSDESHALKAYESLQKGELTRKLGSEIQSIAPTESLTHDATKGGDGLVKAVTEQYQAEKKALGPAFKSFDAAGVKAIENPQDLLGIVQKAIPGAEDFIKVTADTATMAPYKASMPFSKTAYNAIKDMVEAANDDKMTIGGLRNIRESMRDSINWLSAPREAAQISSLRKAAMDYMESQIERSGAEAGIRDSFKRYAINEENRSILERVFGGSISDKASFAKEIKSEEVLNKLFANSVTVKAAKEILPAKTFNKAVGDYLSMHRELVTDAAKNGFSSQKFSTFLRGKQPELAVALADSPQVLAKMNAYADIMRILPDSPSINPSGTAKTLNMLGVLNKVGSILHPITGAKELVGAGLQSFAKKAEERRVSAVMNEILAGKSLKEAEAAAEQRMARQGVMAMIKKANEKAQKAISTGAEAIFKSAPGAAAVFGPSKHDHKKVTDDLHSMNLSPEEVLDKLNHQTQMLYAQAPNSTAGFNQSIIRATQFLSTKVPQLPPPTPLGPKFEPSRAQVEKFERYYAAVQEPLIVMSEIREGTIVPETIEAIKSVYPKMYEQM